MSARGQNGLFIILDKGIKAAQDTTNGTALPTILLLKQFSKERDRISVIWRKQASKFHIYNDVIAVSGKERYKERCYILFSGSLCHHAYRIAYEDFENSIN